MAASGDAEQDDIDLSAWGSLVDLIDRRSDARAADLKKKVWESREAKKQTKKPHGSHRFRALMKEDHEKEREAQEQASAESSAGSRRFPIEKARAIKLQRLADSAASGGKDSQPQPATYLLVDTFGSLTQQRLAVAARSVLGRIGVDNGEDNDVYADLLLKPRPISTLKAEAIRLDIPRTTLKRKVIRSAAGVVLFSGYLLGTVLCKLEALISTGSMRGILICLSRRYDETPSGIIVSAKGEKQAEKTAKVMQSECAVLVLVECVRTSSYHMMRFQVPTWLQAIEHNTGDAIRKTQQNILDNLGHLERTAELFQNRIALTTTDSYSGNWTAEAALKKDYGQWTWSHRGCDVHRIATCNTHMLRKCDGHCEAMIASALAMTNAGSTRKLRQCLLQVLSERLDVCYGPAPCDQFANDYREAVLNLFLPDAVGEKSRTTHPCWLRVKMQRHTLRLLLNGDWQDWNRVCYWTTDASLQRDDVMKTFEKCLVGMLLPCKAPLYSRSKWTGIDKAVSYFGLLTCVHGLFLPSVMLFTADNQKPQPSPAQPAEKQVVLDAEVTEDYQAPLMEILTGDMDWKEITSQMKTKMKVWAQKDPAPVLVVMGTAIQAPLRLLYSLLARGTEKWELEQRTHVAKNQERSFAVVEACKGSDLQVFFSHLAKTFHQRVVAMPLVGHVRKVQVLLFRLLSASGCSVRHYLGLVWGGFPVQLFRILLGNLDRIAVPECVQCPLTQHFASKFSPEEWYGDEAQHFLTAIASEMYIDIAQLEAQHASTRRITTSRSVQVTKPDLESVSAEWVLRRNKTHRGATVQTKTDSTNKAEVGQKTKVTYRSNAWTAFLSEANRGSGRRGFQNAQELSEKYQNLSAEELAYFQRMAEIAETAAQHVAKPYAPINPDVGGNTLALAESAGHVMVPADSLTENIQAELKIEKRKAQACEKQRQAECKSQEQLLRSVDQDTSVQSDVLTSACSALEDHFAGCFPRKGCVGVDVHLPADLLAEAGSKMNFRSEALKTLKLLDF